MNKDKASELEKKIPVGKEKASKEVKHPKKEHHKHSTKQKKKKDSIIDPAERILGKDSSFDTVETYKSIRTNVMFSMPKTEKGRAIVITSTSPGEGKTTSAINLAITFAQMGAKVLLMDCDLRKSRIHRYLNLDRKNGVSNVLCGYSKLDKAIKRDVRENLDCITAGEIPPNPAELLETEQFDSMLEELREQYDYIFIDTPPMTVVTDAAIIIKKCMGVIVVVRLNVTIFDLLDITMEDIKKTGTKILGTIVLGADEKHKKYGYYKKRKYGCRYGLKYGYSYKYKYDYGYHYGYGDKTDSEG